MLLPRWELPPRARRIPLKAVQAGVWAGTTSACAENTTVSTTTTNHTWNYLRVRGEYALVESGDPLKMELPPRARRILCLLSHDLKHCGTTSACAENTFGEKN